MTGPPNIAARLSPRAPRFGQRRAHRWLRVPAALALSALVLLWTGAIGHALLDQAGGESHCPVCHLARHLPAVAPAATAQEAPTVVVRLLRAAEPASAPRRLADGAQRSRAPPPGGSVLP